MKTKPLALALLCLACDGSAPSDAGLDAPRDAPPVDAWIPPVPADPIEAGNAIAPGDPGYEGQQRFLYDAFGTEALGQWPPAEFLVELMTAEPAVFGEQFASFGFVADPDRDLPYGLARGLEDEDEVHETCALATSGGCPTERCGSGSPTSSSISRASATR